MSEGNGKNSILEMARGAMMEQFDLNVGKILGNIMDLNTPATKKRSITLKVEFEPNEDRNFVGVSATTKVSVIGDHPVKTSMYVAKNGNDIEAVENIPQVPGQLDFFGGEQEEPMKLKVVNGGIK